MLWFDFVTLRKHPNLLHRSFSYMPCLDFQFPIFSRNFRHTTEHVFLYVYWCQLPFHVCIAIVREWFKLDRGSRTWVWYEAITFSLITTATNLVKPLSYVISYQLIASFFPDLVEQSSIAADTPDIRRDFAALQCLVILLNLSSLLALPLLVSTTIFLWFMLSLRLMMLELPLATAKDWDTEPGSKRRNVSLLGQVCHDFNVLPPLLFNDHHIHDCGWPWFTWLLENIWWERMHRWRERCTCLLPHLADISLLLWNKLLSCLLATLAKFVVVKRITWTVPWIWWLYLIYNILMVLIRTKAAQ